MSRVSTINEMRFPLAVRTLNKCGALLDGGLIRHGCAQEFIDAARKQCQLDNFGGGEFRHGLARLLESCHGEAQLNFIGKLALRSDVSRLLRNRLYLERDRRAQPLIARQKIEQPLFIVGLPRTGTTLLHMLLSADRAHRAPLTWEVMEPSPPTSERRAQRMERTARDLAWLRYLAPDFGRVHAIGAELPQECVSLFSATFMSDQFDTMYNVPGYRAWFLRQDLSPAYQFHRRFLQHLQTARPGRRWILKAPAHMFALPALLSVYPDALFVQTHRAPLRAVASVSSLITMLRRVFSDAVDPVEIGREALRYWSETLQRFMSERDRLPSGRVFDLPYYELQSDPISAARQVYQYFDWPFSPETEQSMKRVLASQARELRTFHRYDLGAFGLELEEETEFFGEYCRRLYAVESRGRGALRAACEIDLLDQPAN
jgi:Sulfotransferase family